MTTTHTLTLQAQADALGPWRYSHQHLNVTIKGDPVAAPIHGGYGYGRKIMEHILSGLQYWGDLSQMRALDLGCLEGHYPELLCAAGFGEVIALDLSAEQVERANFLVKTLKGYKNVTVLLGSVEDKKLMGELGKFDVILFHGLLYHLKDPISIFETLSHLATQRHMLLLSTQFKFPFAEIITPSPIANIKFRTIQPNEDNLVKYEGTRSTYATMAARLNPAALNRLLRRRGFADVFAYDTPLGCDYGFQVNLVATTNSRTELLKVWNNDNVIPHLRFYPWNGDSLDSFSLSNGWRSSISRFVIRVAYSVAERLGGSAARQTRRKEISNHNG
jgi:2-polyprenyl-3-methyl-5-hydroxy-6-metoxy-1,4-benzoquinol methylase